MKRCFYVLIAGPFYLRLAIQFLATGTLFLSALAAISEEELEQLRPNLLPHEVRPDLEASILARGSSFRIYVDDQADV